jgi:peptidoglycan biosynthesis protein MviN/MurJ (putative lipid II flippase)
MTRKLIYRLLLLHHVTDERFQEHGRRSTSAAAIVGVFTLFVMLQYRLLIEHRVSWDIIIVIYAMGATKIALMLWYRFSN